MGLLDAAIRDHLELKRLRGADPGEVAREQQEALDPVVNDGDAAPEEDLPTALEDVSPEANRGTTPVGATPGGDPHATPQPAGSTDSSNLAQETAELDMRTVLGEHQGAPPEHASPEGRIITGPTQGGPSLDDRNEDSLEWEVPGESSSKIPADGGQHVPYTQGP
jgi:hypothetical protein